MIRHKFNSGLEALEAIQKREQAEHDHAVVNYSPGLLVAVYDDLSKRKAWNRKDHEQRWIMSRMAACARRAQRLQGRGVA